MAAAGRQFHNLGSFPITSSQVVRKKGRHVSVLHPYHRTAMAAVVEEEEEEGAAERNGGRAADGNGGPSRTATAKTAMGVPHPALGG